MNAIHRRASITRPDIRPKQKPADVCIGFSYRHVRRWHLNAAPSVKREVKTGVVVRACNLRQTSDAMMRTSVSEH
jgi:hypothetical protein